MDAVDLVLKYQDISSHDADWDHTTPLGASSCKRVNIVNITSFLNSPLSSKTSQSNVTMFFWKPKSKLTLTDFAKSCNQLWIEEKHEESFNKLLKISSVSRHPHLISNKVWFQINLKITFNSRNIVIACFNRSFLHFQTRQHSTQTVGNMPPPSPRHLLPHVLQIMPRNLKYDQFQPKGHHNEENPESATKMPVNPKFYPFH